MKRFTAALLVGILAAGGLAFGQTTIKWFANANEYQDYYRQLIAEFNKVEPKIKVDLEITQDDYPSMLKIQINAGNIPDIYNTLLGPELASYADYSADLSAQPFVKNILPAVLPDCTLNGKVLAVPVVQNGFGIIYNKKMFADAGITKVPKTVAELEAACKKLQAKGVTPFANGFKEWWVFKHIFMNFQSGQNPDVHALNAAFQGGKAKFKDDPVLLSYFDMIDLFLKYGAPNSISTDFNGEMNLIGTGKVAMITGQGIWAEPGINKIDPSMQLGIFAIPVGNDPAKTKLVLGADHAWRVNKDSPNLAAVYKFLDFWYNSGFSQKYWTNLLQAPSPIKGTKAANTSMNRDIQAYSESGNVYSEAQIWSTDAFHQKFGELTQDYIAKAKPKAQVISEMEAAWISLGAK
jgi:raffinose/stachyose/melibiose transport system substrate-binding protein